MVPEGMIKAIAERHLFQQRDYVLKMDVEWSDRSRTIRELVIAVRDGRSARVRAPVVPSARDRWNYMCDLEAAFAALSRRGQAREA